jgi:four helix bundle protein
MEMQGKPTKGEDLEARLVMFAVKILDLCDQIPKTPAGCHISGQLLRSGSSPAPNYGEVRGAESTKDFIHKLGVVLKELNETRIWLKILRERKMVSESEVRGLYQESDELCRIIGASKRTAMKRKG